MKIAIAIVLTLVWVVYTASACHEDDKPVILPYFLGLILAAIWGNIL